MAKPVILCVDDQREVLAALTKDLEPLAGCFELIDCESADEATAVIDDLEASGHPIALVISDHVMPGRTGVELLADIHHGDRLPHVRKMLLTGLATHDDTIRAINEASIDSYVGKPWETADLLEKVRKLITHFVLDALPDDQAAYRDVLDGDVLMDRMKQTGATRGA